MLVLPQAGVYHHHHRSFLAKRIPVNSRHKYFLSPFLSKEPETEAESRSILLFPFPAPINLYLASFSPLSPTCRLPCISYPLGHSIRREPSCLGCLNLTSDHRFNPRLRTSPLGRSLIRSFTACPGQLSCTSVNQRTRGEQSPRERGWMSCSSGEPRTKSKRTMFVFLPQVWVLRY